MTNSKFLTVSTLAIMALGIVACGDKTKTQTAETPIEVKSEPSATANSTPVALDSLATGDMIYGDPAAPVTLIEFASVTCGHCAAFHEQIYPTIKEQFIDTGKVKLLYREFPTNPPQLAYMGFALARCTADRAQNTDAYFATIETLYKTQHTWISENFKPEILKVAAQAGMDEEAVKKCFERQEIVDAINENIKIGDDQFGVTGTPSFFIGKEKIDVKSTEDFVAQLQAAVDKAGK